jgi:ATP-dependent Lhr-like helicase
LTELVAAGLVTSDGFAGLRALVDKHARADLAGRWSLCGASASSPSPEESMEAQALAFLRRYGVVFRRVLTRESNAAAWRDLARVYRRLEARGEIRGGRFVNGMSGEQFALPQAVERLREVRREQAAGRLTVISAADPLNLTGIIDSGERIRAIPGTRIAYRDGVAVSAMEGDYLRPLAEMDTTLAMEAASALAGRRVPVASGFVGR